MRHRKTGRKLGRNTAHREAMFANLAASLIEHGRLETTVAKAKELRPIAEKLVTLGKKGDVASRRLAFAELGKRDLVKKLFDTLAPRFVERHGGYTRILRTRAREGDGAEMAIIEFLS